MKNLRNVNSELFLKNISIKSSEKGIKSITLVRNNDEKIPDVESSEIKKAYREIEEYLKGKRKKFTVEPDFTGIPEFYRKVYKIAMEIPYGETRTYGWIAKKTGKEKASRAVGNALAKNPYLLVVPCHRIIKSDGSPGGFGIGIDWKMFLLNLEKKFKNKSE